MLEVFGIVESKEVDAFAFATSTAALETKSAVLETAVTPEIMNQKYAESFHFNSNSFVINTCPSEEEAAGFHKALDMFCKVPKFES